MAIQIADGFQLRVAKPLDDRQNVETVAQLDPTYGYEGQIVYVKDIKQFYTCYKDENGSLAYKVMEIGSSAPNESAGIELWVSGESYKENDFVIYNDYIYRCLTSNSDVDFDEANWKQLTYGIDELFEDKENKIIDVPESYTRCLDTDTGALKVVADGSLTDATTEVELSVVISFIDDIAEGEYVLHTDEVSHMETETVSIYMPREETYDKQTIDDKIVQASTGLENYNSTDWSNFYNGLTITSNKVDTP